MSLPKTYFYPITPGGTICTWLAADTEKQAWEKLLKAAAPMSYVDVEDFKARGYLVEQWPAEIRTTKKVKR